MTFIPKDPQFIGLDTQQLRMAVCRKKGKNFVFPKLVEFSKEDLAKLETESIAISLPTRDILIKNLSLPLTKDKEIAAAFEFQVEPLLPYPLEKCVVNYLKSQTKEEATSLTVFSTKKETLSKCLQNFEFADFVTSIPVAIAALAEELPETSEPFFFVLIGKDEGTFALFEKGKILHARFFESEKKEIERAYLALTSQYKNKKIETIYLISEEENYYKSLSEITQKKVELPNFPHLAVSENDLKKFGLAIALALAAAKKFPNFRQKELANVFPFKKRKKPILIGLVLVSILFGSIYTLGLKKVAQAKQELFSRYKTLLNQNEPISLSELETSIYSFQKKLEESPDLYPLVPIIPKISDLMAWMAAEFPNVFKIEDFRYHIVKKPDSTNKNETYSVMVDMTFQIDNPSIAEAIRSMLATQNPFVDAKKDLGWEINKGKYKTTFYLKDKTRYN